MYEDDPRRQASEVFEDLMYGDQPAGWDIGGTPETVKNITRDDIVNYKKNHYIASNAVVAVAGNIDSETVFSKIERAFSKMREGKKVNKLKVKEAQRAPQVKFKAKQVDQTHLRLGVRAYGMHDERRYALQVLATILGGNMSSYLWKEIREKAGLTYYISAGAEEYTDSGYLLASAGVAHENLLRTVKKIVEILRRLKGNGVSESEIKFAKEFIRGSTALAFETTDEVATFLAAQELFYGKILTPQEILRKIERVSRGDIIKIIKEIFRPNKINLAAITPQNNADNYKEILAGV